MDQTFRRHRAKIITIAIRAYRMQAHVELFIRTLRNEVLDHFIIFGAKYVNSLLKITLDNHHRSRPHQGTENKLLTKAKSRRKAPPPDTISVAQVRYEQKLGGLLKSYGWAA